MVSLLYPNYVPIGLKVEQPEFHCIDPTTAAADLTIDPSTSIQILMVIEASEIIEGNYQDRNLNASKTTFSVGIGDVIWIPPLFKLTLKV